MPDNITPPNYTSNNLDINFGEEIKVEESGFAFRPISGFELEIDGSVYMYSEDGNLEICLMGGELPEETSITELNDDLAAEFMENFDNYDLFDAGTDTIQGITGFLNDVQFFNAEEEGFGRTLICAPQRHQYFFILMIASSEYWQRQGDTIFNALKSRIRFHPQFTVEIEEMDLIDHPDLTVETYESISLEEEFVLRIEKGDVSLLLAARSQAADVKITLLDIYSPDGDQLYHYPPASGQFVSQISDRPVVSTDGEICVFFPRNNQQRLQSGEYRFAFSTETGAPLQEIQVIIRAGRALEVQAIDLNFYAAIEEEHFTDPDHLNAFESNIRKALNNRFAPVNLTVGEIEFYHPPPDELAAFTTVNMDSDLSDCSYMITETVNNARALNIGLVDQLVHGDPPVTADSQAVSSGSPGMIMAPASPHACIVIGWSALEGNPDKLADAIIEQLIIFSGIETKDTLQEGVPLALNHEIAWRLRRHPIFYDVD